MGAIHAERRAALRARVARLVGSRPLIVTHLSNIRYLSGFSGSNAVLVVGATPQDDLIATDGRYADQVQLESSDLDVVIDRATLGRVLEILPSGPVAVEPELTLSALATVRAERGEPMMAPPMIIELRTVKEPCEVELISRACRVTSEAFEALAAEIRVGMTERAVARRLEQLFGDLGGDDRAFPTIVAAGVQSAVPHHRAADRRIEEGDLVVIDAGAQVDGYHADMTRTWVVGAEPSDWEQGVHDAVRAAQEAAIDNVAVGAMASAMDGAARSVLRDAGWEDHFTHGLGHGVGLDIHEAPTIGARATGTIHPNMVFTVEPGLYFPGVGGVRIEDTLVVTDTGPRLLTEGIRGLRVVGV
jgi:Xaa-Pro aminopeptidase